MIWIGPGPHGNAAAAVAHSLHVGFYNKADTLAVETAVKCIVVHPICGADLKDEAEIRGPAAADPVPDRTRVKHHVQPFVFPGHGKKGIIGDPIPMETDLKSTGFLIRFQGNMGLSLPQGQREGAQMPGVLLQHIDAAVVVVQKAGLCRCARSAGPMGQIGLETGGFSMVGDGLGLYG